MKRRVAYEFRGSGRFGGYSVDAPFETLIGGVEAAWNATSARSVQLKAAWDDDPDWDALLRAAGWQVRVPRRHHAFGITISHGPLRGDAAAAESGTLRCLVAAASADEMPRGPYEVTVTLPAEDGSAVWTFTLSRDVLEVVLDGRDRTSVFATVERDLKEAATRAGLRLKERT